ncbi:nucleotide-diphospho-sugar transferase [Pelagophyceae sp. CCMP2097]|nr:nucleotide-diphospho-sugar transferase [Pelagophyceae sp. CCMP2097]
MAGMNIMIPLGIGSRFQKEGYPKPKPFVRVLGREMILWVVDSLKLGPDDTLIVVYNPTFLDMKPLMEIVRERVPGVVLVELPRPTLGAAETVRFGLEGISAKQRTRPCMLVDGDAFYTVDIVGMYRAVSGRAGASFVFHDTQPKPIYSYVKRDGNSAVITAIKEKVKISDWANTGCYCFKSGSDLLAYCALIIEKGETQLSQDQKGEFYTSGVIKAMLDAGEPFEALVLAKDAMHVLGTPAQLVEFCQHWPAPVAQRFCFDIDNTLFTAPRVSGDYSTCEPLPQKLKMLRDLHAMGHYIILCTARRMRTHAGNVGAVIADIGATTIATLAEENVPYHELHFGKPWAQFYIDDHAVSAYSDLDKELGYYPPSPPVVQTKYTKPPVHTARAASKKDPSWLTVALATYAVAATACILLRKK